MSEYTASDLTADLRLVVHDDAPAALRIVGAFEQQAQENAEHRARWSMMLEGERIGGVPVKRMNELAVERDHYKMVAEAYHTLDFAAHQMVENDYAAAEMWGIAQALEATEEALSGKVVQDESGEQ